MQGHFSAGLSIVRNQYSHYDLAPMVCLLWRQSIEGCKLTAAGDCTSSRAPDSITSSTCSCSTQKLHNRENWAIFSRIVLRNAMLPEKPYILKHCKD